MATKSFIKTIGEKGLLADYNTEGKKLQTQMTAGDNITIDGSTISSNQLFVATYGTTTYDEVKAAYDAGKICTVFKDGKRHYHITEITPEAIKFGSISQSPTIYTLTLFRTNKWTSYDPWLQTHLTFDSEPKAGSSNPVTSDGIKKVIDAVNADIVDLSQIILPILGNTNALGITDANDAGVGVLLVNTTISHLPESTGILCTYGTSSTSNYLTQFYIATQTNNLYTRSKHGGTWVAWKKYDSDSILPDFLCIVFDYFSISDVTTATANKYVQATGYVGDAVNFSMSQTFTLHDGESVFIYGGAYNSNVSVIAKYVGSATYYEPKVISTQSAKRGYYYTNESGSDETIVLSYSELRKPDKYIIGKINSAFKPKDETPEFSVFETFGVIGDSYASGVIYNSAGTASSTFYNKSWPQILGRKNGIKVTNYSFGGARTNTWLTNATYGLSKLLSDEPLDAYAIVLSINDRNNGGAEWLGTIDDIHVGDPSLNADSFYGCYAKIIENVLSHAPNAKIFCVQHAYNKTGLPKDYNDAISAIASLYNLPCVPEFEDPFFSSAIYTQMYGGHPTYVGYAGMADALCRLFRKAMVAYKDYFKQYVPIP